MYKITRKRVVREVKVKYSGFSLGPRTQKKVTHNATITGMDKYENVLVLSAGDFNTVSRALTIMHSVMRTLNVSDYDINTTGRLIKRLEEAFATNPTEN